MTERFLKLFVSEKINVNLINFYRDRNLPSVASGLNLILLVERIKEVKMTINFEKINVNFFNFYPDRSLRLLISREC